MSKVELTIPGFEVATGGQAVLQMSALAAAKQLAILRNRTPEEHWAYVQDMRGKALRLTMELIDVPAPDA